MFGRKTRRGSSKVRLPRGTLVHLKHVEIIHVTILYHTVLCCFLLTILYYLMLH